MLKEPQKEDTLKNAEINDTRDNVYYLYENLKDWDNGGYKAQRNNRTGQG